MYKTKFTSITFLILSMVTLAFIVTGISVVMIADRQLVKIIDKSQNTIYGARLDVILKTLGKFDVRLQKTGYVEAYSEDFKSFAVGSIEESYYAESGQEDFPFILDHDVKVLLHPELSSGDTTLMKGDWANKMISAKDGDITVSFSDHKDWYICQYFAPWDWTVCYMVPIDVKYASASTFTTILITIISGISIFVLLLLTLIISRFTSPISRLTNVTKEIAAGNLSLDFKSTGVGEVGILAHSFKEMRDAILDMITELTDENAKRKLAEKKYRSLVDDLNDWVWEVDETGVYTYSSPAVERILGYTVEEVIGKNPFDFMTPDEADRVGKIFSKCIENKSVIEFVVNVNLGKNGEEVVMETLGRPIIDNDGIFKGYRGVDRDITQRQKAEEALQAEKERLSVTLRSIGDAVITTDIEGNVIFLNKVAEELTGWTNESAQGNASTDVFHIINERTGLRCASPVQRVLELGRIIGLANHTALIAKDGATRSIADSGAPIRDRNSKIIGVVLVFRDITHEKKTEEELIKVRKLESVGVLAGGIAHDFNNILAAILGNIELAGYRIDEKDVRTKSLLSDAKKATKRATKLTGQLLTFSRGGEPLKEETSLATLISETTDFVLHGSKVICNYGFPEDLWKVDVDSGQIGQVIQNIIINAKQAMPEGGTITIQCANVYDVATEELLSVDKGNFVRITIQDTGIGISKTIIDKIFDPYFTTKQKGSGLGLAISYSIINKHDGYLIVESTADVGSLFTLYLPAILSVDSLFAEKTEAILTSKVARVMYMDDEEMLRNVTEAQLLVLGHESILVNDGMQAINKYQELQDFGTPVDLVIMDLTIPGGMGGQEAAEKLLQIDPEAKIVVASGYSNDPIMADYRRYGFCGAVAKPFDLKQLNNVIASTL